MQAIISRMGFSCLEQANSLGMTPAANAKTLYWIA